MNENIAKAIDYERAYQDSKWGTVEEHQHSVEEWIMLIDEYVKKAMYSWIEGGDKVGLFRVLQITTLGLACMEQHGVSPIKRTNNVADGMIDLRKIVLEVADLVRKFYQLQNYAGQDDYLPHWIAHCLEKGSIPCPGCNGTGSKWHLPEKPETCIQCDGEGEIDFVIPSLMQKSQQTGESKE